MILIFILSTVGAAGGLLALMFLCYPADLVVLVNNNNNLYLDLGVISVCVSLFGFSVYKGLNKGT